MFFADRIKNILPADKVLEIGPGSSPHVRSDVLLEKSYESDAEYAAQLGHGEKLSTDKKVVFYDGDRFPFDDNEFDYVICSHVLEHIDDLENFLSEVFRVSSKGYFEYPLIYYEYLYNFDVHKNLLKFNDGKLFYIKKSDLPFEKFAPVQQFFYATLQQGHVKLINDLSSFMIEGFEWNKPFNIIKTDNISDVVWRVLEIPPPSNDAPQAITIKLILKKLINKISGSR